MSADARSIRRLPARLAVAISITLLGVAVPSFAVDDAKRQSFLGPEVDTAIEKGLAFLANQQRKDGSLTDTHYPAASTAIGVMAFITNGELPNRGRYGNVIHKALLFLVKGCRDPYTGLIASSVGRRQAMGMSLYEHAFCLTVLSELYGDWKYEEFEEVLESGAQLLMSCQNLDGGFPYEPTSSGQGTIDQPCAATAILALRALRDALQPVPQKVIDRAITYLRRCAAKDGSYAYDAHGSQLGQGTEEAVVRTGVGLLALWALGNHQLPEVQRGVTFLAKRPRLHPSFPFYGAYYQVRAMYQGGGAEWQAWYPAMQREILKRQKRDGSFGDRTGNTGAAMDTAFAITALGIQKGLLPLFER